MPLAEIDNEADCADDQQNGDDEKDHRPRCRARPQGHCQDAEDDGRDRERTLM
jgi:hypothetical protein